MSRIVEMQRTENGRQLVVLSHGKWKAACSIISRKMDGVVIAGADKRSLGKL